MSVRLLLRTSERVRVVSPWDPAVDEALRDRLRAHDLSALDGRRLDGATWFEVRGLSAGEIRRLRPLLPPAPVEVAAWLSAYARDNEAALSPFVDRAFRAWQDELGYVYLRAALEKVEGLDLWPIAREDFLGLQLWPESATDALPPDTGRWLGAIAYRLSMLDPEKKSPSGSPPAELSGTTAERDQTTAAESG